MLRKAGAGIPDHRKNQGIIPGESSINVAENVGYLKRLSFHNSFIQGIDRFALLFRGLFEDKGSMSLRATLSPFLHGFHPRNPSLNSGLRS